MDIVIVAFLMSLFLVSGAVMLAACRLAAISDRQDELLLKKWLSEHPEKEMDA